MRLAFVLPDVTQQMAIDRLREQLDQLRPDQESYLEHLIRSWGVFRCHDGIGLVRRAYRRTLNDRP